MSHRGPKDWSREELPIGTVRIRTRRGGRQVRMIKVRADAPRSGRWINFARWWWEKNRGPIPVGQRVVHRNGDFLDDDPSNFILASAGDVAYLARVWDPKLDAKNARAVSRATKRCNFERSQVRRALEYLPGYWYPVDVESRIVKNAPHRSRLGILRFAGLDVPPCGNGRGFWGTWLGWPGVPDLAAFILLALRDGPADWVKLSAELTRLHGLYRFSAGLSGRQGFYQAAQVLRDRSWLISGRVGKRGRAVYYATVTARKARQPACQYVPCRGREIEGRFPDFKRGLPMPTPRRGSAALPAVIY